MGPDHEGLLFAAGRIGAELRPLFLYEDGIREGVVAVDLDPGSVFPVDRVVLTELSLVLVPHPAGVPAEAAGPIAPADAISRSILIVEDNEDFSGLLAETLEDEGHRVQVAGSGTAALDLVRAEVPDFMIIDIGISDMDGYTIADKVRQIPGTGKAVLIALSGYNPDTEKAEKYFNHYIIKGSGIEKVFDIVNGD